MTPQTPTQLIDSAIEAVPQYAQHLSDPIDRAGSMQLAMIKQQQLAHVIAEERVRALAEAVERHGPGAVAEQLGMSRQRLHQLLRQATEEGTIRRPTVKRGRRPRAAAVGDE